MEPNPILAVLDFKDFAFIAVIVLICVSAAAVFTPRERNQLARLEQKVDLLLKDKGIEYLAGSGVPSAALEALRAGNKIEAIKLYREATGAGLKEAKEAIERVEGGV